MPNRRAKKVAPFKSVRPDTTEVPFVPELPAVQAPLRRRGPGRPKKVDLAKLISEGQIIFLRGSGFEPERAEFVDRHKLHPLMLDCDAWWNPKTERLLFVNTRPKSEQRFLVFSGLEDRAEHEMRISGLSVYRVAGKAPVAWGE